MITDFIEMDDCDIYRYIEHLNDNQDVLVELYDFTKLLDDEKNIAYFEIGILVYNTNNFKEEYENYTKWYNFTPPPSTGTTPFKTLPIALKLLNFAIGEVRKDYPCREVIIGGYWMDQKRKRIYGKVLNKQGFQLAPPPIPLESREDVYIKNFPPLTP